MKLSAALCHPPAGSHPVRLIKAADAAALLPPEKKEHAGPRAPTQVRMVASGPDYCDLEVVCGCGEVTRFRCWNGAAAENKSVATASAA